VSAPISDIKYDSAIHHRRSIRLKEYDYSQAGAYFITIVTQERECLFGEIIDGEMQLNTAGELLTSWWHRLPGKFPSVSVDTFVVMPNHLHGIIAIDVPGQTHGSAPTESGEIVGADLRVRPHAGGVRPNAPIPQMIQWFKTMTTNAYIHGGRESGWAPFKGRLWQRN
jgi:REP element-mobilizing transposase RayT